METTEEAVVQHLLFGFQKDLIVWKLPVPRCLTYIDFKFQKDLIVWKPRCRG